MLPYIVFFETTQNALKLLIVVHLLMQEGPSSHCYVAVLELSYVQPSDHAEYMFLVRSPRGVAEASIQVNVTLASGYHAVAKACRFTALALSLLAPYVVDLLLRVWQGVHLR